MRRVGVCRVVGVDVDVDVGVSVGVRCVGGGREVWVLVWVCM